MVSFGIVNTIIMLFSLFTRINNLMHAFAVNMFSSRLMNFGEYEIVLLTVSICILSIISLTIVKFNIFGNVDFFRDIMLNKKMKLLVMDLKYVFHDFKNILMTIIALKQAADINYGTEEGRKALDKIGTMAMKYAKKISDLQSFYKQKRIVFKNVDLLKQASSAVLRIAQESSVPVYIVNMPNNPDVYKHS